MSERTDGRIDLKPPRRRRGLWRTLGFLMGGPVAAFNAPAISNGARTIRDLAGAIHDGPSRDPRIMTEETGALDLRTMAFRFNTSEAGIDEMLRRRGRQTARATWSYLVGGLLFLGAWFYEAILTPSYASLGYLLGLLAVCGVFFLSAFKNALVNWQVRTRRLGTVREFLNARETWWPS